MKRRHKIKIHPHSVPANSAHTIRTQNWCKKLEVILNRTMACTDAEEFEAIQKDATELSQDIARYSEEFRACDVASRRLVEAFLAPNKLHTLEHLTEVALWLNSIGLSPYLAAK